MLCLFFRCLKEKKSKGKNTRPLHIARGINSSKFFNLTTTMVFWSASSSVLIFCQHYKYHKKFLLLWFNLNMEIESLTIWKLTFCMSPRVASRQSIFCIANLQVHAESDPTHAVSSSRLKVLSPSLVCISTCICHYLKQQSSYHCTTINTTSPF